MVDTPEEDRRPRGSQSEGDGDGWMAEEARPPRPALSGRGKTIVVVTVAVVLVLTVVLCCVAVGTAGQLFDVDPRLRPP